jgi:hyaluronan synthase
MVNILSKQIDYGYQYFLNTVNNSQLAVYFLYVQVGVIGIWRWGIWLIKKICAQYYVPILPVNGLSLQKGSALENPNSKTISIITPVYNENPEIFRAALMSWEKNSPSEIIAVIDKSDTECISVFRDFAKDKPNAKLIITSKPGKRPALADGIKEARGELVSLTDSDSIWDNNIKEKIIAPFYNESIGAVTPRFHPIKRNKFWEKMTDFFWDIRNYVDLPAQTATGQKVSCISGRTATYRRNILLPILDDFLNEIIFGRKKESGEDKCLTRMIQRAGWKTYYQQNAVIFSSGAEDFKTFWKQRLRWSRNSHNSDLISLWQGWVWKSPFLALFMIDRIVSTFTLFIGPIFFCFSLYYQQWVLSISILILWIVGRGIRTLPHLRRKPRDLLYLPCYLIVNFVSGLAKLYALVTIKEQKWIRAKSDRVDSSLKLPQILNNIKHILITCQIFVILVLVVYALSNRG